MNCWPCSKRWRHGWSAAAWTISTCCPAPAVVEVAGGGGHFTLSVVSPVFAGQSMLNQQRLVLGAITHLMKGDRAPVHAVDKAHHQDPVIPGRSRAAAAVVSPARFRA